MAGVPKRSNLVPLDMYCAANASKTNNLVSIDLSSLEALSKRKRDSSNSGPSKKSKTGESALGSNEKSDESEEDGEVREIEEGELLDDEEGELLDDMEEVRYFIYFILFIYLFSFLCFYNINHTHKIKTSFIFQPIVHNTIVKTSTNQIASNEFNRKRKVALLLSYCGAGFHGMQK